MPDRDRRDQVAGVDPATLNRWLDEIGVRTPVQIERIGLGQSNLTYAITDGDGRRRVLRRPPVGTLLASAHDVLREARIMTALRDSAVPVPEVIAVAEAGELTDVPVVLMEFVDGVVLDRMDVATELGDDQRRAVGLAMPMTLARINGVDLDAVGLADLAGRKPYATRQLDRWSAQWQKSRWQNTETDDVPLMDQLAQRLRAAIPEQTEVTLVHGDFHLRNVIVAEHGGDIRAVVDWELSTLGDPLADIGSMLAYWAEPGDALGASFSMSALPGFPGRDELAEEYLAITGRSRESMQYWHALGVWKIAVIVAGVVARTTARPENRAQADTPSGGLVSQLAAEADVVATRYGI
ncbi:phosphotransferase family protein [Williamsia sterculiae]|uniref:Predicted kinase, aminoglycoside phosphotransferase (APT) family n=1 Tax=Williamsia sterculiae TaxID=1344003 RepID=A0A1N7DG17_9NOCA|nr:phosphotransferase family protein [Williamsia sterculiae]SIR74758.1 Predicted kinase, aminoglycoside phosphotransferase (APT) family [Williamsia sterculiae]